MCVSSLGFSLIDAYKKAARRFYGAAVAFSLRHLCVYERQPPAQQDADSYNNDGADGVHGLRSPFLEKLYTIFCLFGILPPSLPPVNTFFAIFGANIQIFSF
jgi:hypothetical protein